MIIDKSLLHQSVVESNDNAIGFDMMNYSLTIMRESMMNTKEMLLQESIITDKFSIENIMTSIVNAIIKVLKMILGKFLELLVKLASMGKSFELEVRAYKNKIKEFNGSIILNDSYKYTYIFGDEYEKFPDNKLADLMIDDINDTLSRINNICSSRKSFNEIRFKLASFKPDIDHDINVFRAKLIGKINNFGDPMSDEMYNKECFKLFRNGQDQPSKVILTSKEIYDKIYIPYIDQRKNMDKIKKDNSRVQKNINSTISLVKKLDVDFSRFDDAQQQTLLQGITDLQTTLCTLYERKCKDIVTMYTAKLQAYKDFLIYARPWLVKAMQQITYQGVVGDD